MFVREVQSEVVKELFVDWLRSSSSSFFKQSRSRQCTLACYFEGIEARGILSKVSCC